MCSKFTQAISIGSSPATQQILEKLSAFLRQNRDDRFKIIMQTIDSGVFKILNEEKVDIISLSFKKDIHSDGPAHWGSFGDLQTIEELDIRSIIIPPFQFKKLKTLTIANMFGFMEADVVQHLSILFSSPNLKTVKISCRTAQLTLETIGILNRLKIQNFPFGRKRFVIIFLYNSRKP